MPELVQVAVQVLPLVSVVSIVMIVCAVVAASQAKIAESGLLIMAIAGGALVVVQLEIHAGLSASSG